jgi:hypothetical protein
MEKRFKRYRDFLSEELDSKGFENIIDDVRKKIESTVEGRGEDGIDEFVQAFLKNPDDVTIDGLIQDDQVYDFWLKYENEIDEILNDIRFFENSPSDLNALGTYKYIMACVKKAISEVVGMISNKD